MKNSDKNRDPARAAKRAVADARCALRKLGLLRVIADARDEDDQTRAALLDELVLALGITGEDAR